MCAHLPAIVYVHMSACVFVCSYLYAHARFSVRVKMYCAHYELANMFTNSQGAMCRPT